MSVLEGREGEEGGGEEGQQASTPAFVGFPPRSTFTGISSYPLFVDPENEWELVAASTEELLDQEEDNAISDVPVMADFAILAFSAQPRASVHSEGQECAICLRKYSDQEDTQKLACGHLFHFDCLCLWVSRRPQCPCCRAGLPVKAKDDSVGVLARVENPR
jgi:hypothetical protein